MFEGVWLEGNSLATEELVLELDPVQSERMEEALQEIHAHQHCEGNAKEDVECKEQLNH